RRRQPHGRPTSANERTSTSPSRRGARVLLRPFQGDEPSGNGHAPANGTGSSNGHGHGNGAAGGNGHPANGTTAPSGPGTPHRPPAPTVETATRRRPAATSPAPRPSVRGKFLFVGDEKLYVKGVTYGPFAPEGEGGGYRSRETVERDFGT